MCINLKKLRIYFLPPKKNHGRGSDFLFIYFFISQPSLSNPKLIIIIITLLHASNVYYIQGFFLIYIFIEFKRLENW